MSRDGKDLDHDVVFTPAKRVRSFEDVVGQIQEAIMSGRLAEGERLPSERELCAMFGVSRPTLREGLRWLEALGIVEIRQGSSGGVYTSRPNGEQAGFALEALMRFQDATARDLDEFRASFESETAYWAALRADEGDAEVLGRLVAEIQEAADREHSPWELLSDLDLRFHVALSRASKNQVRVAIMLGIHRAVQRASLSLSPIASSEIRRSIGAELAGIVQAIRAKDARLAKSLMRHHVKRFSELESSVEERGGDWRRSDAGG